VEYPLGIYLGGCSMRTKNLLMALVLFVSLSLIAAGTRPVHAADVRSGDRVVIEAGEVIDDDLVVSANVIQVDGTITGDLVASGSDVVINGTVQGSAILAGQTLTLNGRVDGSVYAGAYSLILGEGSVVGRNLYFAGYSLNMYPDSLVQRDVLTAGYQMVFDGVIGGDLIVSLSALELNGQVGGDVTGVITTGSNDFPPQILFPNMPANIQALDPGFRSDSTAQVGGEIQIQEVMPVEATAPATGAFGLPEWLLDRIGYIIGLIIVAALVVYLAPRFLPAMSDTLQRKPLASLGCGALIHLLLFPLAVLAGLFLIVLLTILFGLLTFGEFVGAVLALTGSLYAFLLSAFLFYAYIIAWLILGHLAGRWLLSRTGLNPARRLTQFLSVALGVLLFQLLRAIPVAGFLVALFVSIFALGALFTYWVDRRQATKPLSDKQITAT
jgi:hypothetical protein